MPSPFASMPRAGRFREPGMSTAGPHVQTCRNLPSAIRKGYFTIASFPSFFLAASFFLLTRRFSISTKTLKAIAE